MGSSSFARLALVISMASAAAACSEDSNGPTPPTPPLALTLAPIDSGFDFSVFVAAPPGDTARLMVVQRGGRILLRKNGLRQDSAFLNLTNLTDPATGEYGVYSVAFHPQYASNRRLFVYYADLNGDSQLAEYLADPTFDHADPATRRTILSQPQAPAAILYGGTVAFGADGMLYLGLGDGESITLTPSAAQDSASLLGKILRLEVDGGPPYQVPPDNPYVGRPGWRGEIWQLGLRNPWRWTFDRTNGGLWIADVGENAWEEIDFLPAPVEGGNNFGWPFLEGAHCFQPAIGCPTAGLIPPILEYTHDPACSITGGYVYRGSGIPELRGTYFYGDYCAGWVRSFRLVGGVPVEELEALASPLVNDNVVSFGEDANGEIYVVMASGRIYRIEAK